MQTSSYGRAEEAARIYHGGEHSYGLNVARYLNLLVPKESVHDFLEVIIMEFEHSIYEEFEVFSKEVLNTYSANFLCLWFLAKLSTKTEVFLQKNVEVFQDVCSQGEREILSKYFNTLIPNKDFKCSSEISRLSKGLWKGEPEA